MKLATSLSVQQKLAVPGHLGDTRIGCESSAVEIQQSPGMLADDAGSALTDLDAPGLPIAGVRTGECSNFLRNIRR